MSSTEKKMKANRRALMLGASAAILAGPVRAQSFPKQIRIVVPYAPGGYTDIVARLVARQMTERLGQPVIVENRAGASTIIGAEYDRQQSFSRQSSFDFLQSCATKVSYLLPFLKNLRIMRQWTGRCDVSSDFSPVMGFTPAPGFVITTGWGTWGFKAIPAGGEAMAELIATDTTPEIIEPFSLNRFATDHSMADQGSTGTR